MYNNLRKVFEKVIKNPDTNCWLWQGYITHSGYGQYGLVIDHLGHQEERAVHRIVYESLIKPIPNDLVIDHLCRVKHCVNPQHMELVTSQDNLSIGRARYKRYLAGSRDYLDLLKQEVNNEPPFTDSRVSSFTRRGS